MPAHLPRTALACLMPGALVVCLLAACASAPTQPTRWSIAGGERAATAAGKLPPGLQLRVTAAPWINQTGFLYSLDYKAAQAVEAYAHNQWIDRPPVLIEDLMMRAYAQARSSPQPARGAGEPRPLALNLRVVEFVQHYASATESEARVAAVATLSESNPPQVRSAMFRAQVPTRTPDAAGGAQAFSEASDQLIEQVFTWAAAAP
ncbi:ABC-type transport auxiliary lipoprotein family protein [Cupriavidus sp. IDO]|uniref:ABC-type transport auxiliary lipoprotein family protein n=1 Tax=Cupriavidus sp. IDO TaxID=1539142 RepID=UPI001269D756|nr:ABC-type transport auxiliary lipoprotein family protein [Cupriavidus sp. IDO]